MISGLVTAVRNAWHHYTARVVGCEECDPDYEWDGTTPLPSDDPVIQKVAENRKRLDAYIAREYGDDFLVSMVLARDLEPPQDSERPSA